MTPPPSPPVQLSSPAGGFLIAGGVIGGLAIGSAAYRHMFVEGMTAEERKPLLLGALGALAYLGIKMLVDVEHAWWTFEGLSSRAEAAIRQASSR